MCTAVTPPHMTYLLKTHTRCTIHSTRQCLLFSSDLLLGSGALVNGAICGALDLGQLRVSCCHFLKNAVEHLPVFLLFSSAGIQFGICRLSVYK